MISLSTRFLRAISPVRCTLAGIGIYALAFFAAPVKLSFPPNYSALLYIGCCYLALISASRAYEANVTAMQTAKTMFTKTFELLR